MTDLEKRYKELITERVNKYIEEQIGEDKQFMPEDTYQKMYELLYNTFVAGVNASKEVLIIINQEEKKHE